MVDPPAHGGWLPEACNKEVIRSRTTCYLFCENGYEPSTIDEVTCSEDGTFTATDALFCAGKKN